jgi:heme-degrading monooxygenase HmoA
VEVDRTSKEDTMSAVFINVFEVEPSRQQDLVDILSEGTEEVIRHRPGFVSVTLLASVDGRRVINHAEWRDAADAKATQGDPAAAEYARRAAAIAQASPGIYSVVAEVTA